MLLDPLRDREHVMAGSPEEKLRLAEKRFRDLHEPGSSSERSLLAEAAEAAEIVPPHEHASFLESVRSVVSGWFAMESPDRFSPRSREVYVRAKIGAATVHGYIDRLDAITDRTGVERFFVSDYKGLALDTPLPTPSGWTTMGRVGSGDLLIGSDGSPVRVVETTPVQVLACFRLVFDDGSHIVADEVHLWPLADGRVLSTAELYDRYRAGEELRLPASPVIGASDPADLPMSPRVAMAELAVKDFAHPMSAEFVTAIRALRGAPSDRRALLEGALLPGTLVVTVHDSAVADVLSEAHASLGGGWLVFRRDAGELSAQLDPSVVVAAGPAEGRRIDRIETAVPVATRCVAVDAADSLYLAGRSMVPTHNTGRKPSERFADEAFFQLEVYAAALQESQGIDTHQLRLIYTNEARPDGVLVRKVTPEVLAKTRKKIDAVWKGIERAARTDTWPTRKQRLCDWCHFQSVCPAFHPELEGLLPEEVELHLRRGD
jgi:RecB family exonuclease